MTGSERPSPEPLLKKEASPAVLGGREFWSHALEASNALNYRAWGIPAVLSRGIPGNAPRAFPWSFRNFSGISSGKSQPYWGYGPCSSSSSSSSLSFPFPSPFLCPFSLSFRTPPCLYPYPFFIKFPCLFFPSSPSDSSSSFLQKSLWGGGGLPTKGAWNWSQKSPLGGLPATPSRRAIFLSVRRRVGGKP